jgi:hypothetical protein
VVAQGLELLIENQRALWIEGWIGGMQGWSELGAGLMAFGIVVLTPCSPTASRMDEASQPGQDWRVTSKAVDAPAGVHQRIVQHILGEAGVFAPTQGHPSQCAVVAAQELLSQVGPTRSFCE